VREVEDRVLFLHRLVPGGADRSYGIEVGRLAGLPEPVIARAKQVLATLEGEAEALGAMGRGAGTDTDTGATAEPAPVAAGTAGERARARRAATATRVSADQLSFFAPALPHPVVEQLRALDPNHLTPMQALELLGRLAADARRA